MTPQEALAAHLDLTTRQVRTLLRSGVLPPLVPRSGYDLDACRLAYIRYLRGLWSGQVKPALEEGQSDDADYKELLDQEKWREKKRENDIADELIAPVQTLTDALQKVGMQIVSNLEALPLEMKRANPKLTGHDVMVIKKSIFKCCEAISEIQLADEQD